MFKPFMVKHKILGCPQAKKLFLRGIELERFGQLYEAVQHYKRAVQLLPDVEQRLYQSGDHRADTPEGWLLPFTLLALACSTDICSPEDIKR